MAVRWATGLEFEVHGDLDLLGVGELVGELDHGGLGHAGRLHGRGGLGHGQGGRGDQPGLTTLEVDAQVQAPCAQRHDPEQDHDGRGGEPHFATTDEVERGLAPVQADEDVVTLLPGLLGLEFLLGQLELLLEVLLEDGGGFLGRDVRGVVGLGPLPRWVAASLPGAHVGSPEVTPSPLATLMPRTSEPRCPWPRRMTNGRVKKYVMKMSKTVEMPRNRRTL